MAGKKAFDEGSSLEVILGLVLPAIAGILIITAVTLLNLFQWGGL